MKKAAWILAILVAASAAALGWAYSGQYNVAADAPHWDVTTRALAAIRERSIAVRAAGLRVPNLADPALISLGAEHYAGMCTGCHLAPGMGDNEMRQGLYPKPPNLSERQHRSPEETFWIIKHGLKMSGMPAWGVTHDDQAIWGLVAFVKQLPTMDAAAYAAITDEGDDADHDHGEHDHDHRGTDHDADSPATPAGATIAATADSGHVHSHPDQESHDH
jgi:mono/diheme cytochrome c family protein